jgi:hypothetical protein
MELGLFLFACICMVVADMRGFTGNKQWPFAEKRRVKRPDEL